MKELQFAELSIKQKIGMYTIGRQNALGMTDREKLAYTFGKITAVTARKMGYNVVCNPVLDMCHEAEICGANVCPRASFHISTRFR